MTGATKNPHLGSTLDDFLREEGIYEEAATAAFKKVIAWQLAEKMKKKGITKKRRSELMGTSRAQIEEGTDPETAKAIEYGQRLVNAAIDLVGDAKVELDDQWARHPHVVALTILCRTICNFRASLRLVQVEQVVEARTLVRLMYENVLWLNMVRVRGAEFVEEMRQDEFANRKALAQLTMELTGRHGGDVDAPDALKLRSILKDLRTAHPEAAQLQAQAVAADGELETIYFEYRKFSLDAVHCSVTALGRHLSGEHGVGNSELTLSVIPSSPPEEILNTIMHANHALLCAAVGANELVRCESLKAVLSGLWAEFKANGWRR
jgi:antitoxin HicB